MEAQQCVKLTRTNRPFGLTIKLSRHLAARQPFGCRMRATPRVSSRACGRHLIPLFVLLALFRTGALDRSVRVHLASGETGFLVAIPRGKHPFPSRTRQLSPPGPMILRWQRRGKVGRCQDKNKRLSTPSRAFFFFPFRSRCSAQPEGRDRKNALALHRFGVARCCAAACQPQN